MTLPEQTGGADQVFDPGGCGLLLGWGQPLG
jgi:hypothetical protein